jgi:hypothetical protein
MSNLNISPPPGYEFCFAQEAEDWIKVETGKQFDGNRPGELIGYIRLPHGIKEPWTYRAVRKKQNQDK